MGTPNPEETLREVIAKGRYMLCFAWIENGKVFTTRQWNDFPLEDMPTVIKDLRDGISRTLRESAKTQLDLSEEAIKMRVQV